MRSTRPPNEQSATLTPPETTKITRFGLNQTYLLLQSGEMPSIRVGARYFVPRAALMKWLENCGDKNTGKS
jgi:excisionase family DNA binding protein